MIFTLRPLIYNPIQINKLLQKSTTLDLISAGEKEYWLGEKKKREEISIKMTKRDEGNKIAERVISTFDVHKFIFSHYKVISHVQKTYTSAHLKDISTHLKGKQCN